MHHTLVDVLQMSVMFGGALAAVGLVLLLYCAAHADVRERFGRATRRSIADAPGRGLVSIEGHAWPLSACVTAPLSREQVIFHSTRAVRTEHRSNRNVTVHLMTLEHRQPWLVKDSAGHVAIVDAGAKMTRLPTRSVGNGCYGRPVPGYVEAWLNAAGHATRNRFGIILDIDVSEELIGPGDAVVVNGVASLREDGVVVIEPPRVGAVFVLGGTLDTYLLPFLRKRFYGRVLLLAGGVPAALAGLILGLR